MSTSKTSKLSDIRIREISILSKGVRPSVRAARIAVAKSLDPEPSPGPRRRRMVEFVIKELSAVDRPAQAHAVMTIMKRADEDGHMQKLVTRNEIKQATFEDAVADLMALHKCSRLSAMESVPTDVIAAFNAEGERIAKGIAEAAAPRPVAKAIRDFDALVAKIAERDRVSKLVALEKAARDFPAEFRDYQEA